MKTELGVGRGIWPKGTRDEARQPLFRASLSTVQIDRGTWRWLQREIGMSGIRTGGIVWTIWVAIVLRIAQRPEKVSASIREAITVESGNGKLPSSPG